MISIGPIVLFRGSFARAFLAPAPNYLFLFALVYYNKRQDELFNVYLFYCIVLQLLIMHIKKVIIKGFKSYSSQSDFDTFHPRTNVIGT